MRIIYCDDHPMMRGAMRILFSEILGDSDFVEADSLASLRSELAAPDTPDLVLLDIRLPDGNGLDFLPELQRLVTCPISMVSASEESSIIQRALTLGAAGFIPKTASLRVLKQALRLILSGGTFVPLQAVIDSSPQHQSRSEAPRAASEHALTPRQEEIAHLICRALTNREIGSVLGISENTVKTHLRAIYETLGATNRTEAALIWSGTLE